VVINFRRENDYLVLDLPNGVKDCIYPESVATEQGALEIVQWLEKKTGMTPELIAEFVTQHVAWLRQQPPSRSS
jgi:hypothetical protein